MRWAAIFLVVRYRPSGGVAGANCVIHSKWMVVADPKLWVLVCYVSNLVGGDALYKSLWTRFFHTSEIFMGSLVSNAFLSLVYLKNNLFLKKSHSYIWVTFPAGYTYIKWSTMVVFWNFLLLNAFLALVVHLSIFVFPNYFHIEILLIFWVVFVAFLLVLSPLSVEMFTRTAWVFQGKTNSFAISQRLNLIFFFFSSQELCALRNGWQMLFVYLTIVFHSFACYVGGQKHLELSRNSPWCLNTAFFQISPSGNSYTMEIGRNCKSGFYFLDLSFFFLSRASLPLHL